MADTHGSGPCEETRAGSTPVIRTKKYINFKSFISYNWKCFIVIFSNIFLFSPTFLWF